MVKGIERHKEAKVKLTTTSLAAFLLLAPKKRETNALLPTKIIVVKAKASKI